MKKLLLVSIIHILSQIAYAQAPPRLSITDAINQAVDMSFQNKDSALYLANYAVTLAQKKDSLRLVFCAYRAIGIINEDNNDLEAAKAAYTVALSLADSRLTIEEQLTIYTDWAILHRKLANYEVARDYHFRTVQKAELIGNWVMLEDGYNGLGVLYLTVGDFDKSVQYYQKSIEAAQKYGNQKGIVITNHNISDVYFKAQKYHLARNHIEKTYQDALKLGDSLLIGGVLNVYGNIQLAIGDHQDALKKQEMAQHFFEQQGEKCCMAESYLAIADIYFRLNNYTQAESYFNKCKSISHYLPNNLQADFYYKYGKFHLAIHKKDQAVADFNKSLDLSTQYKLKDMVHQNLKALADFYATNQQYDLAFQYSKKANDLGENYFNENKNQGLAEAQFRFDIEKKDLEIESQKKTLTLSKWAYSVAGSLCFALLILLYFIWQQVEAKKKASKNAELLLKELHHRVKNNIQTIASMMRLQARQCQDPSVSAVLLENKLRLETFSTLHQQLYQTDDIHKVNINPFITSIIDKLRFSYTIPEENIKMTVSIENKWVDVEAAIPLGLMLNELLTNSFKYAAPSVSVLEINIDIKNNTLHYSDNGQSLPYQFDFDKNAGFGMGLIKSFSQQLKGKYHFYNRKGFHFDMSY